MIAILKQEINTVHAAQTIRHIIPISGKDSLATAIVQKTRQPDVQYEYLFNDTYAELPEVQEWLSKVEGFLGAKIVRIGESLEEVIYEQGILPGHGARFCTRLAKIYPMEDHIGTAKAVVYYGLRSDESERSGYRRSNDKIDIAPVYPLREAGLDLSAIWHMINDLGLLPPQFFWSSVYERVLDRLQPIARDFVNNLSPWERASLFSWRSRPNCYFCFYQRKYEWVGLLENHPDLYWHAAEIEETVGKDNGKQQRVKMFTWRQGESLRELAAKSDEIREKRVKQICGMIIQKAQKGMFLDEDESDGLSLVSCGLYCGK